MQIEAQRCVAAQFATQKNKWDEVEKALNRYRPVWMRVSLHKPIRYHTTVLARPVITAIASEIL